MKSGAGEMVPQECSVEALVMVLVNMDLEEVGLVEVLDWLKLRCWLWLIGSGKEE